jgi:hypothetical protein
MTHCAIRRVLIIAHFFVTSNIIFAFVNIPILPIPVFIFPLTRRLLACLAAAIRASGMAMQSASPIIFPEIIVFFPETCYTKSIKHKEVSEIIHE